MATNKYGLSRYIPDATKLEIRQRSKFGCVICRCGIYEYEHIIPEYHDAHEHKSEHMCLLCPRCHSKIDKGILSKETVKQKYQEIQISDDVKSPFDDFDLSYQNITVKLGSCIFRQAEKLIVLDDVVVLAIEPPEEGSCFPVLSGFFTDEDGNELFRIHKNEWKGSANAWDTEIVGNEIKIRTSKDKIALHLRVHPPESIEVVALNMLIGQSHIILTEDELKVGRITPDREYYIGIGCLECVGADIGVSVDCKNIPNPICTGLSITGGVGLNLNGTGVKIAVGSGGLSIRDIRIEEANRKRTTVVKYPLRTDRYGITEVYPPRL